MHPYQLAGADHLRGRRRACLADDMGLGKTVQACHAVACLPPLVPRGLVVCPAVVREVWADHWRIWGSGTEPVILRKLSDPCPPAAVAAGCLMIVSYAYATRNWQRLSTYHWDALIIDEAQMAKTHSALRTRALFARGGIARKATHVWWLSGTPIENNPAEIWMPLYFSGKTRMTYQEWVDAFCEGYPHMGEFRITGARRDGLPLLRQILRDSDMFLKRTRAQVFPELPPRPVTHMVVESHVPSMQEWEGFDEIDMDKVRLERELLAHTLGASSEINDVQLAALQGLAKSVSTLRRYNGMLKVAPAAQILTQELESRQLGKVAVIYAHEAVGAALERRLSPYGVVRLRGGLSETQRLARMSEFHAFDSVRVCLLQIRAAGTGITLRCPDVLAVETEWDPASLAQALHRARYPPGDPTLVASRVMSLNDELDRAITRVIARKAGEIDDIWEGA